MYRKINKNTYGHTYIQIDRLMDRNDSEMEEYIKKLQIDESD